MEGGSRKKLPADAAVAVMVIRVYSLCVEKVFLTLRQITAAAMSKIGFMKLEPSGVDAAKIISPTIRPTSRQTASGPLVIKPVNVPMPLVFFRHSMITSMANPISIISTIMPNAPAKARRVLPPEIKELPPKKQSTRDQAIKSRRPTELERKFFKIILYCIELGQFKACDVQ